MEQIPLANMFRLIVFLNYNLGYIVSILFASFSWKIKATTSTQCWCEYWMRKIFAKDIRGLQYLFSPFPVLSSQNRNGITLEAESIFAMAINIYIFSSLPFHYKIIIGQISHKHLGMQWWTKPTRAHGHGDYIWNTLKTFSCILLSL